MLQKFYFKMFCVFLIILYIGMSGCIESDTQKTERKLQEFYKSTATPNGELEIEKMVKNASYLEKDEKRLILIADLITTNFTDPNWNYQQNEAFFCYYPEDKIHYNYCLPQGQNNITTLNGSHANYLVDKNGRIYHYFRIISPFFWDNWVNLNRDPYWIAYQKTGECEALSILFNHTANESGFITRIVRSNGISHWWNEVDINGNDEWIFFDAQQYGMKLPNDTSTYFGNPPDFANKTGFSLCNITKSGVFVIDIYHDKEIIEVTDSYDPNHLCPNK